MTNPRQSNQAAIQILEKTRQEQPELDAFYAFYQRIFFLQDQILEGIMMQLELVDNQSLAARIQQDLPVLAFAQLPIEPETFHDQALEIAGAVVAYQNSQGRPDVSFKLQAIDWIMLAEERFMHPQPDEEPGIDELAADFTLAPYLQWAAMHVKPHLKDISSKKGTCPVCQAQPNLAYLEGENGSRWLVCGRCRTEWRFMRTECPFCLSEDRKNIKYYPIGTGKKYRLYVCDSCKRYIKTIDLREAPTGVVLAAESILTWEMDHAARAEGYRAE